MELVSSPFLKLLRGAITEQLVQHPNAFAVLTLIALRARRTGERRLDGLQEGEAMVGDYATLGLTRQQFRTILSNLQAWQLITIRTTNKGTIAKLCNSDVYDINSEASNQPATSNQPAPNQQSTTNKKDKKERREEASISSSLRSEEIEATEPESISDAVVVEEEVTNPKRSNASASHTKGARAVRAKQVPGSSNPADYQLPEWASSVFVHSLSQWLGIRQNRTDCKPLPANAIQARINELARYDEAFCLHLFEKASQNPKWQGITFDDTPIKFAQHLQARQHHGTSNLQNGANRQQEPNGRLNVEEAVCLAGDIALGLESARRTEAPAGRHDGNQTGFSAPRPSAFSYQVG